MDISNGPDLNSSSPALADETKSNEDSGVETAMEVDDKADFGTIPIIERTYERKEAEKRKRTSSSANYEVTEEQVLSSLQNIFTVKLPKSSESPAPEYLTLSDVTVVTSGKSFSPSLDSYSELISDILSDVLMNMAKGKMIFNHL